jgi:S1-C subfamily serine protease
MSAMTELSNALGDAVAAAATGVVAVLHGPCETTSGIVYDEHHVVTAAHDLEQDGTLEIRLGEERVPATLVGTDPASDLAVLRVERALTPLARAADDSLRAGNLVVAVNQGPRGARARLGIVSRVGGPWRLGGGLRIARYVETDIVPTPGLSGSALVDATGALVGVNATGLVRGVLVTLPLSALAPVVDAIVAHGRVRRAKLGVALQRVELPAAAAQQFGRKRGLIVLGLAAGGPAERAGVLVGDVLVAVAGTAVERVDELQAVLDASKIDQETSVELVRAGAATSVVVKPEAG